MLKRMMILCSCLSIAALNPGVHAMIIQNEVTQHSVHCDEVQWVNLVTPTVAGQQPEVTIADVGDGWRRIRMEWELAEPVAQDTVAAELTLALEPDFWWAPHLAPYEGFCIAQHVFRSPALIAAQGKRTVVVVPDLEICGNREDAPWYMDFDAQARKMWIGAGNSQVVEHVAYKLAPGMTLAPGRLELGFFIKTYEDEATPRNPFRDVSSFFWRHYAQPLLADGQPASTPMDTYVNHTYTWAFNHWKDALWQEFDVDGKHVGGPAFIVNVTQSPNYRGEVDLREYLSIWNQAWFSSLRCARGMYAYAERTGDADLKGKANLTKEFALSAPMKDGIFPGVYRTEMEVVEVNGHKVNRSKGWEASGYWANSNRTPFERGITEDWYHILDASWTCMQMLAWYEELEQDKRLLTYPRTYADKLLALQDERGFYPAWLHPETLAPSEVLWDSPESSLSAAFLLDLARITGEKKYADSAMKAIDALLEEIVPGGRWEDYETYWSCCQWGKDEFLGKRIPRNFMYKQNTLSHYWTAMALLKAHRLTGEARYLDWGRRTLDELSLFQQVWQPPFIYIPALGGFGVMNFDGEWTDARQSLFCELFMEYYEETGEPEYFERGIAALRAAFVMMYCPENPTQKALYEKVHPHFGPEDYGFTMENYGHGGVANRGGEGIGPFTIFSWGNGLASQARIMTRAHFGDVYIDRTRGHAFGIDAVTAAPVEGGYELRDLAEQPREVCVVFEDGSDQRIQLNGTAIIND